MERPKSTPDYAKKHSKLNLLIAKKFTETEQLFNKECLRVIIKIFSGYIERYQDNFDFVFLVLKQVIINYIEKSQSSQNITDFVFPLIHLISSINLNKQKDLTAYADLHKSLLTCVKKLLNSKYVVNEHKEILFNSVVLPGMEELKAILISTRQIDMLERIKLQSVMMTELIESFANPQQIEKFLVSIIEGVRIDNFVNNKCYINEMLIILILKTIEIIKDNHFSNNLIELFTDKLSDFMDKSEQFCKEFRTFSEDITAKQSHIEQISNKLSQMNSVIERIKYMHHFYKIDQLGFEGIFKEKELLLEAISCNIYIKDGFYNNSAFVLIRAIDYLLSNFYNLLSHKFIDKVNVWVEISLSVIEYTIEKLFESTFEPDVLALYLKSLFLKFILKYLKYKPDLLKEIESKGTMDKRRKTIENLKNFFSNPKFKATPIKDDDQVLVKKFKDEKIRKFSEKLISSPYSAPKTPVMKNYLTERKSQYDSNLKDQDAADNIIVWRLSDKTESAYIDFVKEVIRTKQIYLETCELLKKSKYTAKIYSRALTGMYDIQIAKQITSMLIVPEVSSKKPYKIGKINNIQLILDLISMLECNANICGVEEEKLVRGTVDVRENLDLLKKTLIKKNVD